MQDAGFLTYYQTSFLVLEPRRGAESAEAFHGLSCGPETEDRGPAGLPSSVSAETRVAAPFGVGGALTPLPVGEGPG